MAIPMPDKMATGAAAKLRYHRSPRYHRCFSAGPHHPDIDAEPSNWTATYARLKRDRSLLGKVAICCPMLV